jgi:hypothetical protein
MPATPLKGDRGAWDMLYPSLHASDIASGNPLYHTPAPSMPGVYLYSTDGVRWTSRAGSPPGGGGGSDSGYKMTTFTFPGDIDLQDDGIRIYNLYGSAQLISEVFLSVSVPPVTTDIIVDVLMDGTSIFLDPDNRPVIAAGENTGFTIAIDSNTWYSASYLTVKIAQIGTGTVGKNLTVHVVHAPTAGAVLASKHCFIMCQNVGDASAFRSCYIEGIAVGDVRAHAPCFIKTVSEDAVASKHCFIEGTAGINVSTSKHAFITPLAWGSVGASGNQTLDDNFHEYPEFDTDHQFSDEPSDPDSLYYQTDDFAGKTFNIKQDGYYEVWGYFDTYGMDSMRIDVGTYNHTYNEYGSKAYPTQKMYGDSAYPSLNWMDRQYCFMHWVGHLVTDQYVPDVVRIKALVAQAQNILFGSNQEICPPRFVVRRIG